MERHYRAVWCGDAKIVTTSAPTENFPVVRRRQDGKLRLLYEAAPMGFLMEQAGGLALTGAFFVTYFPPVPVSPNPPFGPTPVLKSSPHAHDL